MQRSIICFDFDGCLIDISTRDYTIFRDILIQLGHKNILSFGEYWKLRRAKIEIKEILKMSKVHKINSFLELRLNYQEDPFYLKMDRSFLDTERVLKKLNTKYDCIIITSRSKYVRAFNQCCDLGLMPYIQSIKSGQIDKTYAIASFGNKVMAMVGDTERDILPAKKMHKFAIATTTGIRDRKYLETLEPDLIIDNLNELEEIFL